jgi:hypothetical protein
LALRRVSAQRVQSLEREIHRLVRELDELEREWERLPRLLPGVLVAVPAGMALGVPIAFLVATLYVALLGTRMYLIGVHRAEHRDLLAHCWRELASLGLR